MTRILALGLALALVGCKAKDKDGKENSPPTDPTTGTPVGTPGGLPTGTPTGGTTDSCGDGVVDGDEECDYGLDNGPGQPCLSDCTINPDLTLEVTGDDLDTWGVDGITVTDPAFTGSGSWQATPSEDTNSDGADKFELYLDPEAPGLDVLRGITVADIARVSYATFKADDGSAPDFYFVIYTELDLVDDQDFWYGYRLIAEPLYARALDAPADQWNEWSTDAGPNQLTWCDSHKANAIGFANGQPTLDELQATTAFDWSAAFYAGEQTAIDYGAETVEFLSIQTGSPWESTFAGSLDHIVVELTNGNRLTVDLEP